MEQKVFYEYKGVTLLAPILPGYEDLLCDDFLDLLGQLTRANRVRWRQLLTARDVRQKLWDRGITPDFEPATAHIRNGEWRIADIPEYLRDRAVEIVLPASNTKFAVGALNAKKNGASVVLLDIEDSLVCSWNELLKAFRNVEMACRGTLTFKGPKGLQSLDDDIGCIMIRPRGLHFIEPHVLVDDEVVPAFYFDVAMHLYHNALVLHERGQGADMYLPKLEHGDEAEHCHVIIGQYERALGLEANTTKASVLFEHVNGLLQIEEIMYALKERFVAGNTGWLDYLASLSRVMRYHDDYWMPDPSSVDVRTPCMAAYLDLVVSRCHRRGAMAIGGTATQVAVPGDKEKTEQALRSVLNNAAPYVQKGFDGGWVVYAPFAPSVADFFREAFVAGHTNQVFRTRDEVAVTSAMLFERPEGDITPVGLEECIVGGISYFAGWLDGTGAVAIVYGDEHGRYRCRLMEDAATGQRKREDVWKWLRLNKVSVRDVLRSIESFLERRKDDAGSFDAAGALFWNDVISDKAPPDYFPPELLRIVIAKEQKEFADLA